MGYTQNCEIWHGASLGTLIMIQEEPIWRTMWGPCFGHKRAIFWPFLGKGDDRNTQNCEILHGASLGTLIMIQENQCEGPCFCHWRAIFWPFLGKGDYGIHPELGYLAWNLPGHNDCDSGGTNLQDHVSSIFWPRKGHILAISRKSGLWNTPRIVKLGMGRPWAYWLWFRKNQFEGPGEDHVLAIKGSYFGHF